MKVAGIVLGSERGRATGRFINLSTLFLDMRPSLKERKTSRQRAVSFACLLWYSEVFHHRAVL